MAHLCPDCGAKCECMGDTSLEVADVSPLSCIHCQEDFDDLWNDEDDDYANYYKDPAWQ